MEVMAARPRPPECPLKIGDRVRSLVTDVNVTVGLVGRVTNVGPARVDRPARAHVVWDNDTVSLADAPTLEVLGQARP